MEKMFILLIYWDVSFTHLTLNSLVALICMYIVCMAASICLIAHIQTNKLLLTFKRCPGDRQATAHTAHIVEAVLFHIASHVTAGAGESHSFTLQPLQSIRR